jgi:Tfp pilus assembly protein PilF
MPPALVLSNASADLTASFYFHTLRSAVGFHEAAIRQNPNFADAYCKLGGAYASSGKLAKASESFEKAVAVRENLRLVLGQELPGVAEGRAEGFEEARLKSAVVVDFTEARLKLANSLARRGAEGKLPEAEHHFREAVRLAPHKPAAQYALGEWLYTAMARTRPKNEAEAQAVRENGKRATELLRKALAADGGDAAGQKVRAMAPAYLGMLYAMGGAADSAC